MIGWSVRRGGAKLGRLSLQPLRLHIFPPPGFPPGGSGGDEQGVPGGPGESHRVWDSGSSSATTKGLHVPVPDRVAPERVAFHLPVVQIHGFPHDNMFPHFTRAESRPVGTTLCPRPEPLLGKIRKREASMHRVSPRPSTHTCTWTHTPHRHPDSAAKLFAEGTSTSRLSGASQLTHGAWRDVLSRTALPQLLTLGL